MFLEQLGEEETQSKRKAHTNPRAQKKEEEKEEQLESPPHLPMLASNGSLPRLEPFNPDARAANATGGRPTETFVRLSSSPTPGGPRNSLRLHGRRHFNRGLFVIDLRHIPAGCGTKIKV